MSKGDDIDAIIQGGLVWGRGAKESDDSKRDKVKTKAKKKGYVTGAHGSGSSTTRSAPQRQAASARAYLL